MTVAVPLSFPAGGGGERRRSGEVSLAGAAALRAIPGDLTAPTLVEREVGDAAARGEGVAGVAEQFTQRLTGPDALELMIEVAHDMRSPLGSILFLADRLRSMQSGPLTPVQERQIGLIYSAAFGLSALAGDVIELARGGEGVVHQRPVPFSVADVMKSVASIVQPIAEEKGLAVRLAPPPSDARVGQPVALNRVLLNLTTNALKFTATGGVDVVATQRSRTVIEFSIQDTGRGIPPEVMATLFDPFRRRDNAGSATFSSAGLGLAICRHLVAAMGGDLGVTTSERGTRFFFEIELPLATKL
jgi:signal transduction histidine kinase